MPRLLVATCLLLLLLQTTAGEPTRPRAADIDRLIQQPGSGDFNEREAARRARRD
jgi:hypothetical protein